MHTQQEILKRRAATGTVLLGSKRIVIQAISIITNIFLARLLFPDDFGFFAIITFATTFFTVFSDLGLGPSLIQKKDKLEAGDLQSAFTFQLTLGIVIILAIYVASPILANFYNLGQKGINLFRIYGLIFLLGPFKITSGAILERDLNYSRLVTVEALESTLGSLVTVIMAFMGFGVFSFAIGALVGHFVGAILYFAFAPWAIKLAITKKNLVKLARFGLPFQSNIVFGLFYGPLILLYLGKAVGSQNLGFYSWTGSLLVFPMAIPEIVNRIIFPLGARIQKDKQFLRQALERAVMAVAASSLPVVFIMMAAAPSIIHFFYTDRWLSALPALYLGLLQMGVIAFTGLFAQFLLALGYATVMRNIGFVWAALTWILSPLLIAKFNFVGMSLAGLLVSVSGVWLYFRLHREVEFSFLMNFLPFLVSAAVSGLLTFALINVLPGTLLTLILVLLIGLTMYVGLVMIWQRKAIVESIKLLSLLWE